jgi:hypothetical protein
MRPLLKAPATPTSAATAVDAANARLAAASTFAHMA